MNRLRIRYNEVKSQEGTAGFKPEYTNQLAVEVEYAREALQNGEIDGNREMGNNGEQARIYRLDNADVSYSERRKGSQDVGGRAASIREVSSQFTNAHERFKRLYAKENTRYSSRSENQDGFSSAKDKAYMKLYLSIRTLKRMRRKLRPTKRYKRW